MFNCPRTGQKRKVEMSQEALERFLGRLLTDDAFRLRAASALSAACREEGYHLSDEELRAIRREDFARFDAVSELLDSSIKRFCRV
jgi:hypothetical protein